MQFCFRCLILSPCPFVGPGTGCTHANGDFIVIIFILIYFTCSELTFELRRIRHGERPVTGQNHRDNINNFLSKHLPHDSQDGAGAGAKEAGVANVDPVEQHRPEAVVVEVSCLFL
jgi:hypothetical protein